MADVVSTEKRSWIMSRIRGKNTKPELWVRRFLHAHGLRFRLHRRDLPGCPDLVLPRYKTAVFVNGCFWHGHKGCRKAHLPKSNTAWWQAKLDRNRAGDIKNRKALKRLGWQVLTVWECRLSKRKQEATLLRLLEAIDANGVHCHRNAA